MWKMCFQVLENIEFSEKHFHASIKTTTTWNHNIIHWNLGFFCFVFITKNYGNTKYLLHKYDTII